MWTFNAVKAVSRQVCSKDRTEMSSQRGSQCTHVAGAHGGLELTGKLGGSFEGG